MTTILLTGVGGPAGRSLVRQLREDQARSGAEYVIVGADMADVEVEGLTLFVRTPAADAPDYLPVLSGLVDFVRADMLIPTVSEELPILAASAPLIGADLSTISPMDAAHHAQTRAGTLTRTSVVIGSADAVTIAADKLLTMWALHDAGVAVPVFAPATAVDTAAEAIELLGGPVIRKPRMSRGARGVTLLDSPDADYAVAPGASDAREGLLQRFAPGAEFCAQVFRSPLTRRVEHVVVLRKTGLSAGAVGNATGVERDSSRPDVAEVAAAAIEALELNGPADVDIRLDEDDRPVVLEVNARFGAQSAAAPELLQAVLREYTA